MDEFDFQKVLSRLEGVKGGPTQYTARCPAHDDKHASLSIKFDDGKLLATCHAGCPWADIKAALGLQWERPPEPVRERIVKTYDYRDRQGNLLYQVLRYEPKRFGVRRSDGSGGWIYNGDGVQRVIYRFEEFMKADPRGWVFLAEGEKDVDRLWSLGLPATCNPFGSKSWRPEYNEYFQDRNVAVIVDNDLAGREWAEAVHRGIKDKVALLRYLYLPNLPEHGDVSDWLDVGGTKAKMLELVESAPTKPQKLDYSLSGALQAVKNYLQRLKQGKIIRLPLPWPTLAAAFGGEGIPLGKIGLLVSLTGAGKTWMAYQLALHAADPEGTREPIPTFIINTEMDVKSYMGRFLALMTKNPLAATPGSRLYVEEIEKSLDQVEDIIRTMPIEVTDTADYDIKSVEDLVKEKARNFKFILIDHLGEIDTLGEREFIAFPKFVKRLRDIARINDVLILLVSHLRVGQDGTVDLAYCKRIQNTMDFVLALKAFKPVAHEISDVCGPLVKTFNRSLYVRKNRDAIQDIEIAFNFNPDTLDMEDCGLLKQKKR